MTVATDLTTALEHIRTYGWDGRGLALDHDDRELDEEALGYPNPPIARLSAIGALLFAVDAGRDRLRHDRFLAAVEALTRQLPAGSDDSEGYALLDWEQGRDREPAHVIELFERAIRACAPAMAKASSLERAS